MATKVVGLLCESTLCGGDSHIDKGLPNLILHDRDNSHKSARVETIFYSLPVVFDFVKV